MADIKRYLPEGATGEFSSSEGTCIVCGTAYKAEKLIRRLPHVIVGEAFGMYPIRGYKVCIFCSRHVSDEKVELYSYDMKDWSYQRKSGLV